MFFFSICSFLWVISLLTGDKISVGSPLLVLPYQGIKKGPTHLGQPFRFRKTQELRFYDV